MDTSNYPQTDVAFASKKGSQPSQNVLKIAPYDTQAQPMVHQRSFCLFSRSYVIPIFGGRKPRTHISINGRWPWRVCIPNFCLHPASVNVKDSSKMTAPVVHLGDIVKRPGVFTIWERRRNTPQVHWFMECFAEAVRNTPP